MGQRGRSVIDDFESIYTQVKTENRTSCELTDRSAGFGWVRLRDGIASKKTAVSLWATDSAGVFPLVVGQLTYIGTV